MLINQFLLLELVAGNIALSLVSCGVSVVLYAGIGVLAVREELLEQMDPSFLQETAERYCGSLMKEYFPDSDVASFLEKSRASHRSPTS